MKANPRLALLFLPLLSLFLLPSPPRPSPGPPPPPRAPGRGHRPRAGPRIGRRLPSLPHVRRPRRLGARFPDAQRRVFVAEAERQLGTEWAVLPATRFLDYVRDGNRGRYEKLLFSRRGKLADLVLGELLEGQGRFTDAIADGLWLICEESYWGVPAHVGAQKRGLGPSRRHRAHRRPLRRRDGGASRLDRLPDGRPPRRRPPARARARAPRGGPADPHPEPRARRLLVDGLHAARGEQLEPVDQLELAGERPAPRARPRAARARGGEDRAEPGPLHRRVPRRRRLRRGAELLGSGRGVALRVAGAPARRDRRAPRRLPGAGRPRDRPVHRPRLHRRRLLRGHGRRVGEGEARAGARLPLRPGGGGPVPRRLRLLPRRPPRAVRPRGRPALREPRARPAGPPRVRAISPPRRPWSRSPARSGSPTCR